MTTNCLKMGGLGELIRQGKWGTLFKHHPYSPMTFRLLSATSYESLEGDLFDKDGDNMPLWYVYVVPMSKESITTLTEIDS